MMRFAKYHGIGNDYVLVDCTRGDEAAVAALPVAELAELTRRVSHRHTGVGSDGLILLCCPAAGVDAEVRMRMFNSDGSEGEMCGNGLRCLCKLAVDSGVADANPLRVQTGRGVLAVQWRRGADGGVSEVTVDMDAPILEMARIPAAIPGVRGEEEVFGRELSGEWWSALGGDDGWRNAAGVESAISVVSMGNPHAVFFCSEVAAVPLERLGPLIERHPWFPRRVNVHFVARVGDGLRMRTWERGAGITQACGTGACAVVVAAVRQGHCARRVRIELPGGALRLEWRESDSHVIQTGPAVEVCRGEWPATVAAGARCR